MPWLFRHESYFEGRGGRSLVTSNRVIKATSRVGAEDVILHIISVSIKRFMANSRVSNDHRRVWVSKRERCLKKMGGERESIAFFSGTPLA